MVRGGSGARHRPQCYLSIVATTVAVIITSGAADARHRNRDETTDRRNAHTEEYLPRSASIVVDGDSGAVLQASNPDALRHPASLTKIMTLYLLFERLEAGSIRLDTLLKASEHASAQAPTKLGLQAGQMITAEDAIKGMITKSANDAAVVVAENLGGDEGTFAKLMTQKARALGMTRTTYTNASGLPDDNQATTARDQALLGRAIQERFPRYYKYFSTESFVYHGEIMRNHNHLLGSIEGVDGIKTGFTRASGFNLVTSVHRGGHYIVAVVMGGHSSFERDAHMRELISAYINKTAFRRSVPVIAERERHQSLAPADSPVPTDPDDPIRPLVVKTVTLQVTPEQSTSPAPPVVLSAAASAPPSTASQPRALIAARWPSTDSATNEPPTDLASANPTTMLSGKPSAREIEPEPHAKPRADGGWSIQIGAFHEEGEAKRRLAAARVKMPAVLAGIEPSIERVSRGKKAVYRARFAGFDKASADSTCKRLKRSKFECIPLQN
jgi:D-alanyl-D-alanine carboxypeptidase